MTTTPPDDTGPDDTSPDEVEAPGAPATDEQPTPPVVPVATVEGPRRLFRSRSDSWIGGVAGGVAEYFDTDPTLVRIAAVVLAIITSGLAIVGYVIAWIVIPQAPREGEGMTGRSVPSRRGGIAGGLIWGFLLVILGVVFLLGQLDLDLDWFSWRVVAAGALILIGLAMAFEARRGVSGGLLMLAIILTGVLGIGAVADFDTDVDGAFGEQTIRVTDPDQLEETYSHAFGSLTVDLRDLDLASGQTVRVEVTVAFGEAVVRLPEGVAVRTSVNSVFGSIDGPNVDTDGVASSRDYEPPDWDEADRRIDLELTTVFGSGSIR